MPPPSTTSASLAVSPGARLPGLEPELALCLTSSKTGCPWSILGGGGGALDLSLPKEMTRRLLVGRGGAAERCGEGGEPGGEPEGEKGEGEPGRRRRGGEREDGDGGDDGDDDDGEDSDSATVEVLAAPLLLLLPLSSPFSTPAFCSLLLSCSALASFIGAGTTLAATDLAPREAAAPAAAPARAASCRAEAAAAWRAATAVGVFVASSRARSGFGMDGEGLDCCCCAGGGGGGGAADGAAGGTGDGACVVVEFFFSASRYRRVSRGREAKRKKRSKKQDASCRALPSRSLPLSCPFLP